MDSGYRYYHYLYQIRALAGIALKAFHQYEFVSKKLVLILLLSFQTFKVSAQSTPLNYDEALWKLDRLLWVIPNFEIKEKTENYEEAFKKYCKDPKDCVLKKELVYYAEKIIYETPESKEPYGYLVRYRPKTGYEYDPHVDGNVRSYKFGSYLITTSFKGEDTYSDFPSFSGLNNYPIIYETKKEKDFIWARLTDLPSKKSVWLKLPLKNLDNKWINVEDRMTIFGLKPISSKATSKELEQDFIDIGADCFDGQGEVTVTDTKENRVDISLRQLSILPLRVTNGEVEFVVYKNANDANHGSGYRKEDLVEKIKKHAIKLKIPLNSLVKKNGMISCDVGIYDRWQGIWDNPDLLTEKDFSNPPSRLESIKSK